MKLTESFCKVKLGLETHSWLVSLCVIDLSESHGGL